MARGEMARADGAGSLELSTVFASPSSDAISVAVPDRRSDRIQYLDLATDQEEPRWRAVQDLVERVDAIARSLRERVPEELGAIVTRQRPMVSAYDCGARFERHCDNCCDAEEHEQDEMQPGVCANRRVLSAVLYCVPPSWAVATHGGALRLYRPTPETGGWDGDDALVDVAPAPARLVVFASDERVPHEVLPVSAEGATRYALALWYLGSAPALWADGAVEGSPTKVAEPGAVAKKTESERQPRGERASETSIMAALHPEPEVGPVELEVDA